jgi:hypothetical protein
MQLLVALLPCWSGCSWLYCSAELREGELQACQHSDNSECLPLAASRQRNMGATGVAVAQGPVGLTLTHEVQLPECSQLA